MIAVRRGRAAGAEPTFVHPHARLIAASYRLPVARLAYLDDPDEIDDVAAILVHRRARRHTRRVRLYWSAFYGGAAALFVAGVLVSTALILLIVAWVLVVGTVGLLALAPESRPSRTLPSPGDLPLVRAGLLSAPGRETRRGADSGC